MSKKYPALSIVLRYGVAIASAVGAFVIALFLQSLDMRDPYALVFLAAFWIGVWYGGEGPGILGLVLCTLELTMFLHSRNGLFHIGRYDIAVYCLYFLFVYRIYRFSRLRRRIESSLEQSRDRLEAEVQIRTAELRRRDAYLTEAEKISRTGSWAWNTTTDKGFWSPELLRILGFSEESDLSFPSGYCERVHPDDEPDLYAVWQGALQERTEIEHKHRILRPDGSIRHVRFLGRPFPTCNAETEFIGTVMDVTEQHEDREALRKSLEDNQVLLEKNKTLQEKLRGENISLQELNLALQGELAAIQRVKFEKIVGGSPALHVHSLSAGEMHRSVASVGTG